MQNRRPATTVQTPQTSRPAAGVQSSGQNRQPARPAAGTVQTPQTTRPAAGVQNRQPGRTGSNVPKTPQNVRPENRPGSIGGGAKPAEPGRPVHSGNQPPAKPGNPGRPSSPGHGTRPPHSAPRPVPPRPDPHRVHPARRPPIAHRPVRFWDSGYHYFGYRISSLPTRYVRRVFWGVPYYIVDNVYYRYYGGSYYVSRPPFGVVFTPTVSLVDAICSFAFYADAYYTFSTVNENANLITEQNRIIAENNATIAAQNATIAQQNATIAAQNATIAANAAGASSLNSHLATESSRLADRLGLVQSYASVSDSYYYDDGIFFTKNKSGEYVTIVPPAGALITELPDDYRIVTLGGDEYYAVDDTVYRTTVIDGSVYFEVLGQMTGELAAQYEV